MYDNKYKTQQQQMVERYQTQGSNLNSRSKLSKVEGQVTKPEDVANKRSPRQAATQSNNMSLANFKQ
jgi:hypothetical protein